MAPCRICSGRPGHKPAVATAFGSGAQPFTPNSLHLETAVAALGPQRESSSSHAESVLEPETAVAALRPQDESSSPQFESVLEVRFQENTAVENTNGGQPISDDTFLGALKTGTDEEQRENKKLMETELHIDLQMIATGSPILLARTAQGCQESLRDARKRVSYLKKQIKREEKQLQLAYDKRHNKR